MSQDVRIVAIVRSRPGHEEEVEAAIRACVGPSRKDQGCHSYVATRESGQEGVFLFVEHWESLEAVSAHEKTEHFQTLEKTLGPLLAEPLEIHLLSELV